MDYGSSDYYQELDNIFSTVAPFYDRKIKSNFINMNIRHMELEEVFGVVGKDSNLLEVGCGTGEEASKILERTNCKLTCIDISGGMLEIAKSKMSKTPSGDRFIPKKLAASALLQLDDVFDIVYSFNGALNNEPGINAFFASLEKILKSDGYLIVSLRNRVALGEFLLGLFHLNFRNLIRRMKGFVPVEVGAKRVLSHYYFKGEFLDLVPGNLELIRKRGLAVFILPSLHEKIKSDGLRRLISRTERTVSKWPLFNSLGDETLFVFKRTSR